MLEMLVLSLEGLAEVEHEAVASRLRMLVPEIRIAQDDDRDSRQIDRQTVQVGLAAISATCAALTLALNASDRLLGPPVVQEPSEDWVELARRTCGSGLPGTVIDQIKECRFQTGSTETIRIEGDNGGYEISIHSEDKFVYLRGREVTVRRVR